MILEILFCKRKFMHKYEIVASITQGCAITSNFVIFTVVKSVNIMSEINVYHFLLHV